ncbi:MAG: hypothetical protein ACREE4_12325 [Stellaceae bacterium]
MYWYFTVKATLIVEHFTSHRSFYQELTWSAVCFMVGQNCSGNFQQDLKPHRVNTTKGLYRCFRCDQDLVGKGRGIGRHARYGWYRRTQRDKPYLINTIGLNIYSVFRRWRRVPVVFMPAHVSNRYGASTKGSLLHLLDDAVRAYVFGAPAAAIAMCRAALETVLKRHYGHGQWENVKLGQLVILASQQYDFIQEKRITSLVQKANRIVHGYDQVDRLSDEDDRAILNFLKTVKFLIQRAPER